MTAETRPDEACGLDGVCASCREADLTPTGAEPVGQTLARRRYRLPDGPWDTPVFDEVVRRLGAPAETPDPEGFCDDCLAGTESSEHHEKCGPDGDGSDHV